MKVPEKSIIPSPFMGNFFCQLENHNASFVVLSKNGTTFLKKIAVYLKTGHIPQTEDEAHYTIGFDETSDYLISLPNMAEYENKYGKTLKFAVWRDPVDRLLSTYKFFCLEREFRRYFQFLDLYNDNSFERFMQIVEFELSKSEVEYQDEHIRRQVDYYNPEDVDYIVPIHKLNQFLAEKGIPVLEMKSNATSVRFKMQEQKWIERIKYLYKEDYLIAVNY